MMVALMDRSVFKTAVFVLTNLACYCMVDAHNSCEVGEDSDSSRFSQEIVFGLFPNGVDQTELGEFGSFTQTTANPPGTDITFSRPFAGISLGTTVDDMPAAVPVNFLSTTTVTRTTGIHAGTLRIVSEDPIRTFAYSINSRNSTFGAIGTIPRDYLGQEYFAVVRADPGLGQLVISSTGQPTIVRLTPNAAFAFDEILYDGTRDLDIKLPAWGQATITSSFNSFTGSRILANDSISVVSGTACAYSPGSVDGVCDYAIEQLLPYDRWGTAFNLAPFVGGSSPGYFVQVTAGRDETRVTINGTGIDLEQGDTFDVDIDADETIRITSEQPVQVVKFMKSALSMVLVVPEEQYINKTTSFRMNDIPDFPCSHYFTILIPCEDFHSLEITHRSGFQVTQMQFTDFSVRTIGTTCAYNSIAVEKRTYKITQQQSPKSNFTVEVYGMSVAGVGSYALVGNQKYQRLRCIDYDLLFYESSTKASTPSSNTSSQQAITSSGIPAPRGSASTISSPTTAIAAAVSGTDDSHGTISANSAGTMSTLLAGTSVSNASTFDSSATTLSRMPTGTYNPSQLTSDSSATTMSAVSTTSAVTAPHVSASDESHLVTLPESPTGTIITQTQSSHVGTESQSGTISSSPKEPELFVTTDHLTSSYSANSSQSPSASLTSSVHTATRSESTARNSGTPSYEHTVSQSPGTSSTGTSELMKESTRVRTPIDGLGTSTATKEIQSPISVTIEPVTRTGLTANTKGTTTNATNSTRSEVARDSTSTTTDTTLASVSRKIEISSARSTSITSTRPLVSNTVGSNINGTVQTKALQKTDPRSSTSYSSVLSSSATSRYFDSSWSTKSMSSSSPLSFAKIKSRLTLLLSAPTSAKVMCNYLANLTMRRRRSTSSICVSSSPRSSLSSGSTEFKGTTTKPKLGIDGTAKESSKNSNLINARVRKKQSYIFPIAIVMFGAGIPTIIACYYLWKKPPSPSYLALSDPRKKAEVIPMRRFIISDL